MLGYIFKESRDFDIQVIFFYGLQHILVCGKYKAEKDHMIKDLDNE